jgi:hypothetical protein
VSSEKDYMQLHEKGVQSDRPCPDLGQVLTLDPPLRCVSSGYLSDGCSCRSSIPSSVVTAAWGVARERGGVRVDRFFHFAWRGEVWLAYGLQDGHVRGVYCPTHRAERDEHASLDEPRGSAPDSAPTHELALIA